MLGNAGVDVILNSNSNRRLEVRPKQSQSQSKQVIGGTNINLEDLNKSVPSIKPILKDVSKMKSTTLGKAGMSIFEPVRNYQSEVPQSDSRNQSKASLDNRSLDRTQQDVSVDEANKSMELSSSTMRNKNGTTNESYLEPTLEKSIEVLPDASDLTL